MKVTVVCTGNVARSPALAAVLSEARPDLQIRSAAVGQHATAGRRMTAPMRGLLTAAGFGDLADAHRSRLYDPGEADLVIACAPVHEKRLAALDPDVPVIPLRIPDPAYGGTPAAARAWDLVRAEAARLAGIIR